MPPISSARTPRRVPDMLAAADDVRRGAGGRRGYKRRTQSAPYLFLLPYFLTCLTFFLYPLFYATVLAFYQTNGPARRAFVGWDNFRFVLTDADFHRALWNTTIFTACSIGIQL